MVASGLVRCVCAAGLVLILRWPRPSVRSFVSPSSISIENAYHTNMLFP